MKWRYKNFKRLDLFQSVVPLKMKHYSVFFVLFLFVGGAQATGIDSDHASVFSPDVLGDRLC